MKDVCLSDDTSEDLKEDLFSMSLWYERALTTDWEHIQHKINKAGAPQIDLKR